MGNCDGVLYCISKGKQKSTDTDYSFPNYFAISYIRWFKQENTIVIEKHTHGKRGYQLCKSFSADDWMDAFLYFNKKLNT